jgi:hypothetical protein
LHTRSAHARHSGDRRRATRLVRLLPLSVVLVAASCGAGDRSAADNRAIAIYSAVIRAVIAQPPGSPSTTVPSEPVFVVAANPRSPISLEVQAGIVEALHAFATLRFVDERSEAIASDEPGQPVHEDGVLLTLGEIPPGRTAVTVEVQRYERAGATTTVGISLRRTGAAWEPVPLPAR